MIVCFLPPCCWYQLWISGTWATEMHITHACYLLPRQSYRPVFFHNCENRSFKYNWSTTHRRFRRLISAFWTSFLSVAARPVFLNIILLRIILVYNMFLKLVIYTYINKLSIAMYMLTTRNCNSNFHLKTRRCFQQLRKKRKDFFLPFSSLAKKKAIDSALTICFDQPPQLHDERTEVHHLNFNKKKNKESK